MSGTPSFRRNPLVITGNSLSSGDRSTTFPGGSADSLLRSYLIFVREMRGQRREPSIELRSDDIAVLATHLGVTEELVLGGLLDLMGATRAQRTAMLAMLAAGALTVVLSGSIVTGLSRDGVSVGFDRLADAVQAAVAGAEEDRTSMDSGTAQTGTESAGTAQTGTAQTGTESAGTAQAGTADTAAAASPVVSQVEPTAAAAASGGSTTAAEPRPAVEISADSTTKPDTLLSAVAAAKAAAANTGVEGAGSTSNDGTGDEVGVVAQEPVSIGIAPDGSLVASVAPPVPATSPDEQVATGELPDGTTVGVAAPPVPPPPADEQVATAELPDGTTVGVAAPPVPPPSADD